MTDRFLDKVYKARSPEETRVVYDAWAQSYETEVTESGYATPGRVAAALRAQTSDVTAPVLDFGCGTGLSGVALAQAGFEVIDGVDLSDRMLEEAASKNVYRSLQQIGTAEDDVPKGYGMITAIGVIGSGAAPASALDTLVSALAPGGLLAFSFNDHTLADPVYTARLQQYLDAGTVRLRFEEHGAHLPAENLQSTVYVIEKN